jgi:hypothetical protein
MARPCHANEGLHPVSYRVLYAPLGSQTYTHTTSHKLKPTKAIPGPQNSDLYTSNWYMFLARLLTSKLCAIDNYNLKTSPVKPTVGTTAGDTHPLSKSIEQDKLQEQPFRFLDLSKELRLILYNHLPTYETTHIYRKHGGRADLVTRAECIPILQTCRTIDDEASDYMKANRSRYLASSEPELPMIYIGDLGLLGRKPWILSKVFVVRVLEMLFSIANDDTRHEHTIRHLISGSHSVLSLDQAVSTTHAVEEIYKFARQMAAMLTANPKAILNLQDASPETVCSPEDFPFFFRWTMIKKIRARIRYWNKDGESWLVE